MQVARSWVAVAAALVSLCGPASALVGNAGPADIVVQRYTILVHAAKGRCSGVVLAHNLVLTAAHCVEKDTATHVAGVIGSDKFNKFNIAAIERHPDFRKNGRFVADLALIKLKEPLPDRFVAAFLQARPLRAGDRVIAGGYGVGDEVSRNATLRSGSLVVSRVYANLAYLGESNDERPQLGACGGDSGGPVFSYRGMLALVGIMVGGDCKGATGVVPIAAHYSWILLTAEKLGTPLK